MRMKAGDPILLFDNRSDYIFWALLARENTYPTPGGIQLDPLAWALAHVDLAHDGRVAALDAHLDDARAHVEETYKRPLFERLIRNVLAYVMPRPKLFRLTLIAAERRRLVEWVFEPLLSLAGRT